MNEGRITIPIRKALLRYFNAWLRTHLVNALDVDHAAPVIVANLPAFEAALGEAAR